MKRRTPYGTDGDTASRSLQDLINEYGRVQPKQAKRHGGVAPSASVAEIGFEMARAQIHVEKAFKMSQEIGSEHEEALQRLLDQIIAGGLADLVETYRGEKQNGGGLDGVK